MAVDGVRFNTQRRTSGAVSAGSDTAKPASRESSDSKDLPNLFSGVEVPDVQKILEREELKTLTLAQDLQEELKNEKQQWQARLQELPDKEKLESYRERLKKLKATGKGGLGSLLGATTELTTLEKDLRADVNRLEQALTSYEDELKDFDKRLDQLVQVPMEDVRRLRDKYGISAKGLSNLSGFIFGQRIRGWVETAMAWYDRLAPLLASASREDGGPKTVKPLRGRGLDIQFEEADPLPNFLIRRTRAGVLLQKSELSGQVLNITTDPAVLGSPLTFNFSGKDLENIDSLLLDGRLNTGDATGRSGTVGLAVRGLVLNDANLSGLEKLPITLKQGTAYLNMQTSIDTQRFTATLRAKVEKARLTADMAAADTTYAGLLKSALESVKQLNVTASVAGTAADYEIDVSSDIDRILENAVANYARQQTQRFEKELKQAILAKADAPIQSTRRSFNGFETIGAELQERLDLGQNLMGAQKLPF
jgi:uncharacterized protein (TIGR03545 family)